MSTSGLPTALPTRLAVAGVTDVGRQRKHNEDCVLIRAKYGLFAVADGMGGHNAGDVASKLVAQSLGNYFEATENGGPAMALPAEYENLAPGGKRIAAGVRKANLDVFTVSNTNQAHHGMGSTCVAMHLTEGMAHIAHVGDSRCYRIRNGVIQQMTRDHSLINDALDMKPDLTKEELARLPKNIITRALGMKDAVKVDVKSEPTLPGDTFLLCSDGLTGMVQPDLILEVINLTHEPQEACELLIAEANDAGGNDNISALIVRIEEVLPEHEMVEDAVLEIDGDADDYSVDEPLEHVDIDQAEIEPEIGSYLDDEPTPLVPMAAFGDSSSSVPPAFGSSSVPPAYGSSSVPPAYGSSSRPPAYGSSSVPPAYGSASIPPAFDSAPAFGDIAPAYDNFDDDEGAPTLQLVTPAEVEELPLLDEHVVADLVAAFARGDAIDLDLHGPWPGRLAMRCCARCSHELYLGNRFCTECGTRIDSASA